MNGYCLAIIAATALALSGCGGQESSGPQLYEITVGSHAVLVEIAETPEQHTQGLKFRESLPENQGMLFYFPQEKVASFWMKSTRIPLSIAFIDDGGLIVNIESMEPFTQTTHESRRLVRFALEMNQGWFRKRGVRERARVQIGASLRERFKRLHGN